MIAKTLENFSEVAVRKTFPHLILLVLRVLRPAGQEISQDGMRMTANTLENFSEVSGFLWTGFRFESSRECVISGPFGGILEPFGAVLEASGGAKFAP
jgi:hypothetical protein